MKPPIVTKVEVREFTYELENIGADETINIPVYRPGSTLTMTRPMVRIFTDAGITGEYVGGSGTEYSALPMFIKGLLGRSARVGPPSARREAPLFTTALAEERALRRSWRISVCPRPLRLTPHRRSRGNPPRCRADLRERPPHLPCAPPTRRACCPSDPGC